MNLNFFPKKKELSQDQIIELQSKVQRGHLARELKESIYWKGLLSSRLGDQRVLELTIQQAQPINGMAPDAMGVRALESERFRGRIAEILDIQYDLNSMISDGQKAQKSLLEYEDRTKEMKK